VTAADGRAYAPYDSWAHADDSFDRAQRAGEQRYFHAFGDAVVELPAGPADIIVWRGLEQGIARLAADVEAGRETSVAVSLPSLDLPPAFADWKSADVHVHMNYGGIYRNTPANLVRQAEAEDLDMVFNLIVNKEQRVPDQRYFSGRADPASTPAVVLQHSQEFHTSFWGHLGMLGLSDHLLLPGYSAYPETAAASIHPDNATASDLAHAQGALVGYVHPFLYPLPDPASDTSLTNALPVDVALGRSDYYEVVGFADHRASADIWYRLLNCGFRLAAAGGTDAMANFASLRGPVGVNRSYVHVATWPDSADGRRDAWLRALKAGHSMATNGPLLGFSVEGRQPGDAIPVDVPGTLSYEGYLRSIVPIDHLEVVMNGSVVRRIDLSGDATRADFDGEVAVSGSGWLVLRAWSDDAQPEILDMYPYATTSPIYIDAGDGGPRSAPDADYFLAWIARVRERAATHPDYNTEEERDAVLRHLDDAAAVFAERR